MLKQREQKLHDKEKHRFEKMKADLDATFESYKHMADGMKSKLKTFAELLDEVVPSADEFSVANLNRN